jgi:hypothetical protein
MIGVRLVVAPPSNKFKHEKAERRGAVAKLMLAKVVVELSLQEEWEVEHAVTSVFAAKNRMLRKSGYAPVQVVLGCDRTVPVGLVEQFAHQISKKAVIKWPLFRQSLASWNASGQLPQQPSFGWTPMRLCAQL